MKIKILKKVKFLKNPSKYVTKNKMNQEELVTYKANDILKNVNKKYKTRIKSLSDYIEIIEEN